MKLELPAVPDELPVMDQRKKNMILDIGADEMRALNHFGRRFFPAGANYADVAGGLLAVAMAYPEATASVIESAQRYSQAEGIGIMDHLNGKISARFSGPVPVAPARY